MRGFQVGGLLVSVGAGRLTVGGTPVPFDLNSTAGKLLNTALKGAGASMTFFAPENTAGGVISAGLKMVFTTTTPTGVSPVVVTATFGRTAATILAGASVPPLDSAFAPPALDSSASPLGTTLAATSVEASPAAPGLSSSTFLASPPQSGPVGRGAPTPVRHLATGGLFDLWRFYWVIVAAALITGGAGQAIHQLGEKLRWT